MTQSSTKQPASAQMVVGDRYRLERPIARGGFSTVFRAIDDKVSRDIALKVLVLNERVEPSTVERFSREARLASQLNHPNVVTVHDYGHDDRGFLFIAMEWVEGRSLNEFIDREGALAPRQVAEIGLQTADALEEAHRRGIFHRDLKPSNIMLETTADDTVNVKVVDFGIAKALKNTSGDQLRITREGDFVGTPRYASPERLSGMELTPAADIYGLGLTMWEALVGEPAVPTTNFAECTEYHLSSTPWRIPDDAQCPADLKSVIEGALEKDVDERYDTAQRLSTDLQTVLESNSSSDPGQDPWPNKGHLADSSAPNPDRPLGPLHSRVARILLGVAIGVGLAFLFFSVI